MTEHVDIEHESFVDWRGNTVRLHDLIVFPTTSGRSAVLNIGIVRRIYTRKTDPYNPKRLDVEVVDRKWDWRRTPEQKAKRPISRLKFWDRCLLLERHTPQKRKSEPTMAEMADMTEPW